MTADTAGTSHRDGDVDAVVVGSGISGLVAAAELSRGGWRVCLLERNEVFGGAIRTVDAAAPGYRYELFACWHPLFVTGNAHRRLAEDLAARGVEYLHTDIPTGVLLPDGSSTVLSTDAAANRAEFDRLHPGDGTAWADALTEFDSAADLVSGLLGTELWSTRAAGMLATAGWRFGPRGGLRRSAQFLASARTWLTDTFTSPAVRALLAPWVLHTGLGPDDAVSALMLRSAAGMLQSAGLPLPRGGGSRLVEALVGIVTDHGGAAYTGVDVEAVDIEGDRAVGVRAGDGTRFRARRAVLASVTPTQLYGRLLADAPGVPYQVRRDAARFRYGRADLQINLALSEPPRWPGGDPRLARASFVHVTPGLDGVSRAVNEAERGLLPAEATIGVGQPVAADPSRAPGGGWVLWIQLQELPRHPVGDAAGHIDVGDGTWTPELAERYADRIVDRLAAQIPNLPGSIVDRRVLGPAELAAADLNLVGGDPYSGAMQLDQFAVLRPLPGQPSHATPVAGLYHIGASTHPGPGLHGASGDIVASRLLYPGFAEAFSDALTDWRLARPFADIADQIRHLFVGRR